LPKKHSSLDFYAFVFLAASDAIKHLKTASNVSRETFPHPKCIIPEPKHRTFDEVCLPTDTAWATPPPHPAKIPCDSAEAGDHQPHFNMSGRLVRLPLPNGPGQNKTPGQ